VFTRVFDDYSSKCSANNAQVNSKNYSENCDKLETEYQKTLDELKSAKLIIEILRAEMNPNIASECACIHSTANNIQGDKQVAETENRWINVVSDHAKRARRQASHRKQAN
jgi:hypothetical protein